MVIKIRLMAIVQIVITLQRLEPILGEALLDLKTNTNV